MCILIALILECFWKKWKKWKKFLCLFLFLFLLFLHKEKLKSLKCQTKTRHAISKYPKNIISLYLEIINSLFDSYISLSFYPILFLFLPFIRHQKKQLWLNQLNFFSFCASYYNIFWIKCSVSLYTMFLLLHYIA